MVYNSNRTDLRAIWHAYYEFFYILQTHLTSSKVSEINNKMRVKSNICYIARGTVR